VALLTASCSSSDAEGPSTTPADAATTTTRAEVGTTTSLTSGAGTTPQDRSIDIVDCDSAPDDSAIVCEAFDLIKDMYVDDIDATTLAEAASDGLRLLDGADSDTVLVCAAPAQEFASTCDLAATAADDATEAAEAMVTGMTSFALDPNSGYFDADALDLLQEEQRGEIQGIGALVSPEDQTIPGDNKQCGVISETCEILIVSTIEGAPAESVGLLRDDEIIAVDGEPILGWTVDEVTATVRGPSGSDVTLTIEREGELLDVTITRAAVQIPVIEVKICVIRVR
jgi:C-terminal processing protease CtpA/Prc